MKLFKKESQLTETILAIHSEFNTAGEKLYEEALSFIQHSKIPNLDKVERLKRLGFTSSKEVAETSDILAEKKRKEILSDRIMYYRTKYPLYKFINEDQVKYICEKYGLIYGEIRNYTGFIPEKNLTDIERFLIEEKDMEFAPRRGNQMDYYRYIVGIDSWRPMLATDSFDDYKSNIMPQKIKVPEYLIVGSPKDFDTRNMEIKDYKLQPIPDPVVLAKVHGGYLIVTAWGDEANDPIVKNEINN